MPLKKTTENRPATGAHPIRVLIADDHDLLLKALSCLLEKQKDIHIVGTARNGRTAVELALETHPDVVIMDVRMPDIDGIEATKLLLKAEPKAKVIGLSFYFNQDLLVRMLQAGAVGFLQKSGPAEDVSTAIRMAMAHQFYFSPDISRMAHNCLQNPTGAHLEENNLLTAKEQDVLRLIAEEKNIKEIAQAMHLSIQSVDAYKLRVMRKLNVDTIAGLTKYAVRQGYVP